MKEQEFKNKLQNILVHYKDNIFLTGSRAYTGYRQIREDSNYDICLLVDDQPYNNLLIYNNFPMDFSNVEHYLKDNFANHISEKILNDKNILMKSNNLPNLNFIIFHNKKAFEANRKAVATISTLTESNVITNKSKLHNYYPKFVKYFYEDSSRTTHKLLEKVKKKRWNKIFTNIYIKLMLRFKGV
jgi:hypothetical protein